MQALIKRIDEDFESSPVPGCCVLSINDWKEIKLAIDVNNKPSMPVCPHCCTQAVTIVRDGRSVCSVCGSAWSGKPARVD